MSALNVTEVRDIVDLLMGHADIASRAHQSAEIHELAHRVEALPALIEEQVREQVAREIVAYHYKIKRQVDGRYPNTGRDLALEMVARIARRQA